MQRSVFVEEADQAANLALIAATLIGSAVVVQFFRPWWNATSDAFVAVPALYALAVAGAILIVFLLRVRLTVVDNDRLRWMSVGLMFAGIAALFQGVVIADLREVPELVSPSGAAALSGIWHGALALFALGGALTPHRHRLRRGLTLLIGTLLAVVLFEPAWAVLPAVVDAQGRLTATQRFGIMILLVLTLTAAGAWIAVRGRRATRPDVWIVIMLLLAGLDLAFALKARLWVEAVWWNAVVLRAAQFVVPGVGLLADNARLVGLLRRHEQGLQGQLDREAELAIRAVARTVPDADAEARILQVLTDEAFTPVFQPIVTLGSGELLAVEALTRFVTDPPRTPDQWFDEAHALGRGVELELAALQVALTAARALPDDLAVSVNVSPSTLIDPRLSTRLRELDARRPLILELTEHAPVSDYDRLKQAIAQLRRHDVRIAIDDAGAGFACLRHVVALDPDLIKLDISLTRDIHRDPVRRALADSLADFARRTGTTIIAEGVEKRKELRLLHELGFDAAQGYLLSRPVPVDQLSPAFPGSRPYRLPSLEDGQEAVVGA